MPSVCVSLISGAVRNCPIAVILALKRPSGIDVKAVRPLTRSGSADLDAPGRARASVRVGEQRHHHPHQLGLVELGRTWTWVTGHRHRSVDRREAIRRAGR